jgi:hypothetical protein
MRLGSRAAVLAERSSGQGIGLWCASRCAVRLTGLLTTLGAKECGSEDYEQRSDEATNDWLE